MSLSCHVTFPFSPYLFFLGAGRYVHGTLRTRLVLVVPVRWLVNDSKTFSMCLAPWLRFNHNPMQLVLVVCCHALASASAHPSPRDRLGKGSFGLPVCPFQIFPIELGPGPFQDPIESVVRKGRRSSRSTIDEVHQVQLARTFLAGRRVLRVLYVRHCSKELNLASESPLDLGKVRPCDGATRRNVESSTSQAETWRPTLHDVLRIWRPPTPHRRGDKR